MKIYTQEVPEEIVNYLEGLDYDVNALQNLIAFLGRSYEVNKELIKDYQNDYLQKLLKWICNTYSSYNTGYTFIGQCEPNSQGNIMIHIYDKVKNVHDWCPISIGGEFINEYEELIINGKNLGVNLPKDILKAVYAESLYNDVFNEALYNEKLKEYLINIMGIKGECGNFRSMLNSLKWFGWNDKVEISKLIKTDNQLRTDIL